MRSSNLLSRVWLTLVAVGQIVLTPLAAFTITYLFDFGFNSDSNSFTLGIHEELLRWIIGASFYSGLIALALALVVGGFTPNVVVVKGGWLSVLKLSNKPRDADLISKAKLRHAHSPYGQMIRLVSDQHDEGKGIISIFGGLQLLAIPFQFLVVIVPWLILMVVMPLSSTGRVLEFVVICYLAILIIAMRMLPRVAQRFIGVATFARRWLVNVTKLSILAPVLVLWMLGRIATVLVVGMMGDSIDITSEQDLMAAMLGGASVPQNSFIDLMTALSVLPIAAFTTLAVLGGANRGLPDWLKLDDKWDKPHRPAPIPEVDDLLEEWG